MQPVYYVRKTLKKKNLFEIEWTIYLKNHGTARIRRGGSIINRAKLYGFTNLGGLETCH